MFYRINRSKTAKNFDPKKNVFKCTVNEVEQYFNDLLQESRRLKKEKTKQFLQENPLYGKLVIDCEFIGPKIVPRAEEPEEVEENNDNLENGGNNIENAFNDVDGNGKSFNDEGVELIDKFDEDINANNIEDIRESEEDIFISQIKNNSDNKYNPYIEENPDFVDINAIDELVMMDIEEPNNHDICENKYEVMAQSNIEQGSKDTKEELIIQPKHEEPKSKYSFKKVEIFESNPEDDFGKSPKIRKLDL
jgi:hypothetical protein